MKRIILAVVGVLAIPVGANAQTTAQLIEGALSAAPGRAREATAVIKWHADFTYETLQEGTNRLVCYSRADERDRPPFAVQCTSVANLDRVAQNRRFRAESTDTPGERALVAAAAANGSRILPEFGSMFVSRNGADQESAGTHSTIAVPMATGASTGLPENGRGGGAYVMGAGTESAHIMVPGR